MNETSLTRPKRQRSPWLVLLGGGLVGAVGPAPLIGTTLGVFIIPITESTGWGRTLVTGAFAAWALGMAIGFPLVGWLLNKYALRVVALPGLIGFSASVALIGLLGNVVPLFVLCFALAGFFGAATGIPFAKAMVSWFDNKRGLGIGAMAGIAALGTTVMPLYAAFLIGSFGWSGAYIALAATSAVISIPALLVLVRVRAERSVRGRLVQTAIEHDKKVNLELPGLTLKQAVRHRHFWFIAIGLGIAGAVVNGLQVTLVPLLVERGIDAVAAATLLSVLGLAALVGRVGGGFLLDRVHGTIIGAIVIVAPGIGLFFLHQPFVSALIATAFIGLAIGLEGDLISFFITRYLGMKAYPQILGVALTAFLIGTALGPQLFSVSFDATGSYDPVLPWMVGGLVVSAALILSLGAYRYPAIKGFDKIAARDELAASELLATQLEDAQPGTEAADTVPDRSS